MFISGYVVGMSRKLTTNRTFRRACLLLGLTPLLFILTNTTASGKREGEATRFLIAPAIRAEALTKGPDGNLWFAGRDLFPTYENNIGFENKIGRVTPSGEVVEFSLPPMPIEKSGVSAIITGPDANLWFTESGSGKIGRVTTSGGLTEFPLPLAASRPSAIVAGPDGNLWFTEEATDKIGRITPVGVITEFPISPGSGPAGIAVGPDGNLWFTAKKASKIGRVTPAGSVTEYPLPDSGRQPSGITAGPDGNLWFAEEGTPRIGRIAITGSIWEFPLPTKVPAHLISTGPAGDLWFATPTAIGSISPSGHATRPSCLEFCGIPFEALAEGPEGKLWFGAGTTITNGGGGTQLAAAGAPGLIGKFAPPPLTITIGSHAHPVTGSRTTLRLACDGEAASTICTGSLRLTARIRGSQGVKKLTLGHRRYKLISGESRRLGLLLTDRATKLLSRRGSLAVRTTATGRGSGEAVRRIVLHQAGGPEPKR
jgi:streptogramin lyase